MSRAGVRPEIQAMRALAVGLVVIYHLWPERLPGGYIGVDVFFVISGFLITAHIAGGLERGGFRLRDFWSRRIRRLLPASLLVLLVVTVATVATVPQTLWNTTAQHVIASALYVQNWQLSTEAVDYLAAPADASPVQHFWSLAVEEQFYLLWPVLLLAAWVWSGRRRWSVPVVVGLVIVGSLATSVALTASSPAAAYFVTPTRAWELAAGAAVAVVGRTLPRGVVAGVTSWLGLGLIVLAAFAFSGGTPFPGTAALLPVAGAVLVLLAGDPGGRWTTTPVARLRPVQWLGDVSYSLYLWHWPLIVLVPIWLGGVGSTLGNVEKVGIGVASLVLAGVTKVWVEDPFRRGRLGNRTRVWPVYAGMVATMGVVVAVAAAPLSISQEKIERAEAELSAYREADPSCAGARALGSCRHEPAGRPVVPDPMIAAQDVWRPECQQRADRTDPLRCEEGVTDAAAPLVAVAGDSHAGQWMPALREIALERGWRLVTYLKSGCPITAADTSNPGCGEWNQRVRDELAEEPPELLLTTAATGVLYLPSRSVDEAAAGFTDAWTRITDLGTTVVALADTPSPRWDGITDPPTCVLAGEDCSLAASEALPDDPVVEAAEELGLPVVDLNDRFCPDETCPPIVGGQLVYRDMSHMTATYATSLVPALDRQLPDVVASADRRR